MRTPNWVFKKLISIYLGLLLFFLVFLLLLTLPFFISLIFDFTNGDEVLNDTLPNVVGNISNPDEKALAIMAWEREYFHNPYSLYDQNSTLQKFNIYKLNENYMLFVRGAPVSWIIHSRLANCEEYARVFVTMMNKSGIKANLVHASGEDHVWAEYFHDGYEIAVDPSQNIVIGSHKKQFEKDMNVKFSYVEAIDLHGNIIDVSDEYIERGNLTVFVLDNKQPVNNAQIKIKSPYLMKNRGGRYDKPLDVISKSTDTKGKVSLKLGFQDYIVEARINQIYLLDSIYQKNVTVDINKENVVYFNLENDEKNNELFITR
ncbi:MAG TPA: transglutaminase-like domain-containing protein [Candidatus Methanoperedens sp.]|nr:transglutaminase-like domain-containing protein [Candidatus Methanoperedens sp.]HLB70587.1 transglutaminase-like domain-containing protein [Candidatus Methanoperedens sp.]